LHRQSYDTGGVTGAQATFFASKSSNRSRNSRSLPIETADNKINGPVLALDVGQKRIGMAVSDSLLISITRLAALRRTSWKQLLRDVADLAQRFDAQTVVIGFPLGLAGDRGPAAEQVAEVARKFAKSLNIPVYLQDERLSTVAASERLRSQGLAKEELAARIDSESAAIILEDFLGEQQDRVLVKAD